MQKIRLVILAILIVMLAACSTTGGGQTGASTPSGPGYYTVQKGDTLYAIGRKFGQDHRSIASWNKLENANGIEVGQVLRVAPPGATADAGVKNTDRVGKAPAPTSVPPSGSGEESKIDWLWPTEGAKTSSFSSKKKGIEIAGTSGQPILAAASGKVMYAGAGIRGYGNLLIIKHTGNLLSVYAHNKTILIKEGQMVTRGQKIAEMGKSDSSTVKLYFEIRRDGKPIDPSALFPGH
ncbi:peptidoglycan DD-metalloendopeptidase family protein [Glaciimonas sp. GNP009]|uniref:peptidoglycan DD-metalloendopeptidase family protein n=3 Tax=Glaciimonas sp. CA11.2 TaxID=3048601 RepID=UPI002AB57F21|nr:peptidoglycan DD-metalloendopeptidase family protein [Glaciimonas sp. CA11.2]MDY7547812.1 peptidoglycan DD-metalloendopeptidase family protein [Glaciimonas sp. CA11.2]